MSQPINAQQEKLLHAILSQPTAPFREKQVLATITQELKKFSVPYFEDPLGNLILGVSNKSEYIQLIKKKTAEPVRLFMAHLDHPGFHGMQWKEQTQLEVQWHGGTPTQHLENAKVWLADELGTVAHGVIQSATLLPSRRAMDTARITLTETLRSPWQPKNRIPKKLYGGFRFRAPYWRKGELIYAQAADDLVGAFAIVWLALALNKPKNKSKKIRERVPFLGLLTRAEEVGFVGAIGHFQLDWLSKAQRPVVCISLETSRTLAGAEIGKGPIVRLGDKTTVFNPNAVKVLSDLAQQLLPEKHQRRIMDGGSCEATAATAFGYTSLGISIALGNYHNQNFEGGPDCMGPGGPAPEFVHLQDIQGMLTLCQGLLKSHLPWSTPWRHTQRELIKGFHQYRPLLRT